MLLLLRLIDLLLDIDEPKHFLENQHILYEGNNTSVAWKEDIQLVLVKNTPHLWMHACMHGYSFPILPDVTSVASN